MAAHPWLAYAACRPAAFDRPDDRRCLRNNLPWQRRQRESARCHHEHGKGQHDRRTPPHQVRPPARRSGPRHPESFPGRAEHRLQPRPDKLQAAQRATGHLGKSGHDPGDRQRARRCQPGADPLQAIVSGVYRVRCRVQGAAQKLVIVTIMLVHS
jgi:hypothetical protein